MLEPYLLMKAGSRWSRTIIENVYGLNQGYMLQFNLCTTKAVTVALPRPPTMEYTAPDYTQPGLESAKTPQLGRLADKLWAESFRSGAFIKG